MNKYLKLDGDIRVISTQESPGEFVDNSLIQLDESTDLSEKIGSVFNDGVFDLYVPPVLTTKKKYIVGQFIDALEDSELETLMGKVKTNDQVAAMWERI